MSAEWKPGWMASFAADLDRAKSNTGWASIGHHRAFYDRRYAHQLAHVTEDGSDVRLLVRAGRDNVDAQIDLIGRSKLLRWRRREFHDFGLDVIEALAFGQEFVGARERIPEPLAWLVAQGDEILARERHLPLPRSHLV